MKWTLQNARKHYLKNTPKCKNCEFVEDKPNKPFKCLVKDDLCINLGNASDCKYFTLKEELLRDKVYPDSNEDFDGGYVDFDGDIAP